MAHLSRLIQSILDESVPALEAVGLTPKAFFLLAFYERDLVKTLVFGGMRGRIDA